MRIKRKKTNRRATILVMIVGLLATLFLIVTAYITLARFDKLTLEAVQQGQTVDQMLGSINAVILSTIRQSWADADGNLLAGGRSDTGTVLRTYCDGDIPGYRGTAWLARSEPVRDARFILPVSQFDHLAMYTQTVSSFIGQSSRFRNVPFRPSGGSGLMLENGLDNNSLFHVSDVLPNVRRPFMDADGSGVTDSAFVAMSSLTEMTNAIGGIPVHAPDGFFNPAGIGDPNIDPLAKQWYRFDQRARYEVAVKVISNGGMVALASPGDYTIPGSVWNREFVTEMFNWVRYHDGTSSPNDPSMEYGLSDETLLNDLFASAAAVEPFLRHRGGLLANYYEENLTAVPSVLARLREQYDRTFRVVYNSGFKADASQRFNLATIVQQSSPLQDEWRAWRQGATMDPTAFNASEGGSTREGYNRRPLLTVISNSDELARVVSSDPGNVIGIHPGQLKFYLGDIARAFNAEGDFIEGDFAANRAGHAIVLRLANYFYEMLQDYDDWGNLYGSSQEPPPPPAVKRRQQACMLAVSTVAFAAPRNQTPQRPGFIDAVWYTDTDPGNSQQTTYVGYAPQPYITQVVAYNKTTEEATEPPTITNDTALAVELYYPHDPGPNVNPFVEDKFNNPNDPFALNLSQFAISLNDENLKVLQSGLLNPYPWPVRLSGRNFLAFSINDQNGNMEFDNPAEVAIDGVISDMPVDTMPLPNGHDAVVVKLWRRALKDDGTELWFLVDKFTLDMGHFDEDDDNVWSAYRDTSTEPYLGGDWDLNGMVEFPTRWRIVSNIGVVDPDPVDPSSSEILAQVKAEIGTALPSTTAAQAPTVPLYTMNAGANLQPQPIHGARRPRSFPTVGFMLMVPRFSHVAGATSKPMGEILWQQWEETSESYIAASGSYPADFGHMPIFDNQQKVKGGSQFADSRAGRVPWGLLVYDFFTTLDPNADDFEAAGPPLDPRRVPGRINVNTAPWYVLAGLPVLNPGNESAPGAIDQSASPAFWSRKSGVFVGASQIQFFPDGSALPRFNYSMLTADPQAGWLRLGAQLGQAVASYRDRIRYVEDLYTSLPGAELRNRFSSDVPPPYPYHYRKEEQVDPKFAGYAYDDIRRAGGAHGFLSLGELINVAGFDSAVRNVDPQSSYWPLGIQFGQAVKAPDFFKAVSLMAMLDTHFLTTRGNTFTVYISVMDREKPQASIRSQLTVDRSNLLPQLLVDEYGSPILDAYGNPIVTQDDGLPEIVTQRQIGYYNTKFDQ